jgi:hypothetical protein
MGNRYFQVMAVVLLALTLVAFSDNLLTDVGQSSNRDPKFIVHGVFCLAWMIVFAVQTLLIRRRNLALHRRVGSWAKWVAIGTAASTLFLFWAVWKGWAATAGEARLNRLYLPAFALFVWLGYRNRQRPDWHRRCLLVATLFMMGPVLARDYDRLLVDPFLAGRLSEAWIDAAFMPTYFAVWSCLFLSLGLFDWRESRHLHPVTGWAHAWFGLSWVVALAS